MDQEQAAWNLSAAGTRKDFFGDSLARKEFFQLVFEGGTVGKQPFDRGGFAEAFASSGFTMGLSNPVVREPRGSRDREYKRSSKEPEL